MYKWIRFIYNNFKRSVQLNPNFMVFSIYYGYLTVYIYIYCNYKYNINLSQYKILYFMFRNN